MNMEPEEPRWTQSPNKRLLAMAAERYRCSEVEVRLEQGLWSPRRKRTQKTQGPTKSEPPK